MKRIYFYTGKRSAKKISSEFTEVSDEDYEYLNQWKWHKMAIYHTDNKIFYARRYETINGKFTAILMHRVILGLTDRKDKGDHLDGNGLNNQRSNLRVATHSQNMSNRKSSTKSSSIYLGVSLAKTGTFSVFCKFAGIIKRKHGFISEDVAALKYNEFAKELKGEYARLNVIRWF